MESEEVLVLFKHIFLTNFPGTSIRILELFPRPLALQASLQAIEKGLDQKIPLIARTFFYLPLMHSEDVEVQRRGVEIFGELVRESPPGLKTMLQNNYDYAQRHADIIERFGRFPHRNKILGRPSTPEEIQFLKQPGSSF
jgi:uncharacterized protein (DUF924 family)